MTGRSIQLELGGETLALLPEKAAWLPDRHTLLIADAHIGKAVSFRKLGVPVPHGTTQGNLERLESLLQQWPARRIVFLGDLLHAPLAQATASLEAVARWRAQRPELELTLVRGNHDLRAGDPPADWRVTVLDEPFRVGGLALCHHPRVVAGAYALCGHLHPCLGLSGPAHDRLRLPCFHFGAELGVLPAFGAFTGMHPVRAAAGDRLYVVADGQVVAVTGA